MRIKVFELDSRDEVICKIVREILLLFRVETGVLDGPDYERLSIWSHFLPGNPARLETFLAIVGLDGTCQTFRKGGTLQPDERESAGIHRLIKRNLYDMFRQNFGCPPAPWGILHGVRPTKIVHRWIRGGFEAEAVSRRLQEDYRVSQEKANLLAEVAFRQIPFLKGTGGQNARFVSVYVGIPFCLTRCLYCSFPSHVLSSEREVLRFLSALKKDIAAAEESVRRYGFRVQSIYVGGGTPTSLPEPFFDEMLQVVQHAFYGPDTAEFTVEAGRPDSMTEGKLRSMVRLGVTRASANPQTMQQRTLDRIGRRHTPEDVVRMFRMLREGGIPHINMDLILGLPGETAEDVADSMEKVLALSPDSVTLHALALKRGSRLKLQLEDYELPNDEEARRMSEVALAAVRAAGLSPYYLYRQGYMSGQLENIGCCRKGAECMYNIQIMEERQTILGMGGAATSKVVDPNTGRLKSAFHAKDLMTYLRDVDGYIEKRIALLRETLDN